MQSQRRDRKPILVIEHASFVHLAALRAVLEKSGLPFWEIRPYRGDVFPELSEISGVLSLGGPMGANDEAEHSWIPTELSFLKQAVEAKIPTIGICLGAQMMAKALGSSVERADQAEVGWHPLNLSEEGRRDPLFKDLEGSPTEVYQWHQDTFFLPPGATLLASSPLCPRQAFRIGMHAYGVQFHPEADPALIEEWLNQPDDSLAPTSDEERRAHLENTQVGLTTHARLLSKFIEFFDNAS